MTGSGRAATAPAASEAQGGGFPPQIQGVTTFQARREIMREPLARPCRKVPAPQANGVAARLPPPSRHRPKIDFRLTCGLSVAGVDSPHPSVRMNLAAWFASQVRPPPADGEGLIMNATKMYPVRKLQAELKSILDSCPLKPCDSDCPLYDLRKMFCETRQQWLASLTEEDLIFLTAYHHVCEKVGLESAAAVAG